MNEPILVILAAGMGSRYGKLKQLDNIGVCGETIMEFSMFDAYEAGFRRIVFIIKREFEEEFRQKIGDKVADLFEITYAFQDLNDLPEGFAVPEGRQKPWGTSHALYSARDYLNSPFAVINADDYYGKSAFKLVYDFLKEARSDSTYCMIGYKLKNTTTKYGSVNRGVCNIDNKGHLIRIDESTGIEEADKGWFIRDENGNHIKDFTGEETVSMNMFGFYPSIIDEIKSGFPSFLEKGLKENPLKCEYFIPNIVTDMITEKKINVEIIESQDKWYGVTYKADKPHIVDALTKLTKDGGYPTPLWKA